MHQIYNTSIFHYSGHALVENDQAFLLLKEGGHSARLTDEEIAMLHSPLEMVVLSACETGIGKLEHGEGIRSLGKSFLESGSESAVFSLWTVNDFATSKIIAEFYRQLKEGNAKDVALRNAKLKYLKTADQVHQNPYFWSAFVMAGKTTKLPLTIGMWKSRNLFFLIGICIFLLVGWRIFKSI